MTIQLLRLEFFYCFMPNTNTNFQQLYYKEWKQKIKSKLNKAMICLIPRASLIGKVEFALGLSLAWGGVTRFVTNPLVVPEEIKWR